MNFSQMLFKRIFVSSQLILPVLVLISTTFAAGEIDPTFNGGVFLQPGSVVPVIKRQPDGKVLIGGDFEVVNGSLKNSIVRLNNDGSIDAAFNPPNILGAVRAIAIQPDGKILIGGHFVIPLLTNNTIVARLNADGSFDNTFVAPTVIAAISNSVRDISIASDGKVIIAGNFGYTLPSGVTRSRIQRLNANGTPDMTFNPVGLFTDINDIEIQTDGKIIGVMTDGGSGAKFFKRFNPDGTEDFSFNSLVTGSSINALKIQADGKILIAGDFTFVNNVARVDAARLNTDGTLDTSFNVTTNGSINHIDLDASGKILIGGTFTTFNDLAKRYIARVDANGALDNTFADDLATNETVNVILPLPDGKIVLSVVALPGSSSADKVIRLNANGAIDDSLTVLVGRVGTVTEIIVQPDGKILAAGNFGAMNSVNRMDIGRFNADGSADTTFNSPLTDANNALIWAIALQTDGKILVGGRFSNVPSIIRLNPDGSRDNTFGFSQFVSIVYDIAIQPDGKFLAVGSTNNYSLAVTRRFNADGSIDNTFNTTFTAGSFQTVDRIALQPDGKIIIVGEFTNVNGSPCGRVARLNADGSLDATFNHLGGASGTVYAVALQPDGKIIIGGGFLSYNGSNRNYVARLDTAGNLDGSFTAVAQPNVRAINVESNGKITIGGDFTTVNGVSRNKIARLKPDGTLDLSFNVGTGFNGGVYSLAKQPDNKIIVGGIFTRYNEIGKASIVRLLNTPRTFYDFDGDGRADLSVFRPSNGFWYQLSIQNNAFSARQFGVSTDLIAPADYDADGKFDIAVFRPGAFAYFYIFDSSTNAFRFAQFGTTGDVPLSGDWDGDGRADLAVYRASTTTGGQSNFYYRPSSQPNVDYVTIAFGTSGDKPLYGDFDGDGRLDAAVFRTSDASWQILQSSNNQVTRTIFGLTTDILVPADFDGDGKTNIAVFRPSTGTWYTSQNPSTNFGAIVFGATGDLPVPADYDGDGKVDAAVFRPSNGAWYLNQTTSGFLGVQFGANGDKPTPNAFVR